MMSSRSLFTLAFTLAFTLTVAIALAFAGHARAQATEPEAARGALPVVLQTATVGEFAMPRPVTAAAPTTAAAPRREDDAAKAQPADGYMESERSARDDF